MPGGSNKLSQFWQELRRRKVIKVIAMYAGAAYVFIELANNVVEPMNLPLWLPRLIILMAIIGFPITAVLSWIFDITPEGLTKTEALKVDFDEKPIAVPSRRKLKTSDFIIVALIVTICILLYPRVFDIDKFNDIRDNDGRISVTIMPLENLTGDSTLNWLQRGISSLIINGLATSSELSVRDDYTMHEVLEGLDLPYTAGISLNQGKEVAQKVTSQIFITGNYQGSGNNQVILINLIATEDNDILYTTSVSGNISSSDYLEMANSICNNIKNFLEIMVLKEEADFDFREAYTSSSTAYKYFVEGMNATLDQDYKLAVELLQGALTVDSSFVFANFFIAWALINDTQWNWDFVEPWIIKAYKGREKLPYKYRLWIELYDANYIRKNLPDIIRYKSMLENSDIHSRLIWFDLGTSYLFLNHPEKAVKAFEKIEQINRERGEFWKFRSFYSNFGQALHQTGKHNKEQELYELGLNNCPEVIGASDFILHNQAVCAVSSIDTIRAKEALMKMRNRLDDLGFPAHVKEYFTGYVYEDAHKDKEAFDYFQRLYDLAPPGDRIASYTYGRSLIKNDVDIEKGLELLEEVIETVSPDTKIYYVYLYMKCMGLLKMGNISEAWDLIQIVDKGWVGYYPDLYELRQDINLAMARGE